MAFPVIIVDSASGSDSAASGAGPGDGTTSGSALTGTAASTDGAGTVVTLDGSPDLTNVATDGSHVIYLADSTAGKRNFGKITAKDNTSKTVTVADAFALSASGLSWAIGGKRASIGSATSKKLFDNNTAAGDAMPGWVVEMQSGHSETLAATYSFRRSGDTTSGPITLRGAANASVLPLLTFSNNGAALQPQTVNYIAFRGMELRNSHGTKTASYAILCNGSSSYTASYMKVSDPAYNFAYGFSSTYAFGDMKAVAVYSCDIGYCAGYGIDLPFNNMKVHNCYIHHAGSHGIANASDNICHIVGCLIESCGGRGIYLTNSGQEHTIIGNTIHNNASHGIESVSTYLRCIDNLLTYNGGYGLKYNSTEAAAKSRGCVFAGNNTYGNVSGAYSGLSAETWQYDYGINPEYLNPTSGQFVPRNVLRNKGAPLSWPAITSNACPGVIQPREIVFGPRTRTKKSLIR